MHRRSDRVLTVCLSCMTVRGSPSTPEHHHFPSQPLLVLSGPPSETEVVDYNTRPRPVAPGPTARTNAWPNTSPVPNVTHVVPSPLCSARVDCPMLIKQRTTTAAAAPCRCPAWGQGAKAPRSAACAAPAPAQPAAPQVARRAPPQPPVGHVGDTWHMARSIGREHTV